MGMQWVVARVKTYLAGVLVGERHGLNLVQGTNITLTVVDDPSNDKVDVTIASSGGASVVGGADKLFLIQYEMKR